ncbi:MAG: class I SAM-dependent DNA methyltransferase [Dehalococcoidia bacterium]|nr:class I SAM-dependent DNA methyltransferase [Dehalococcoidia bacterium]
MALSVADIGANLANQGSNLSQLEDSMWNAADNLRANSRLTSSEYCMPVLGVIFLRHASNRYNAACLQIVKDQAAGRMAQRPPVKADYLKRRAMMLPPEARYDELLKLPKGANLGAALVGAMNAIERDFEPLANQLPKDYDGFDNDLLENLLRTFDTEILRTAGGDVFGRIYEYFLMKFAMQGAQDNGEFFTPPSLVQTIVNVIEPDHGTVFDPACGSGGMFVQSSHFIEERLHEDTSHRVTFFGQEKTATTIRLAKMNLAVHGLEGDIREANTFYEDVHSLYGKCDFVMANPPFNVDMVDAEKVKDDRRLPFGLPGVNKAKKVSNGNYLWISYFHSYLGPQGRAGFVMSSQASSAGHGEAEVRRKLIETGDVDVMISIRSNFFYTRSVPCELWHLDRGKPSGRRDQVLMIDARNVYRKVTRKINDFSPEQLANLTAIVWLYRGQPDRFIELAQGYLDCALAESAAIARCAGSFREAYEALAGASAPFLSTLPTDSTPCGLRDERDEAAAACFEALGAWTARIAAEWSTPCKANLPAQTKLLGELGALASACRDLVKDVDLACKLASRLVDAAEKDAGARDHDAWDSRAIGRLEKELEARRKDAVEQLKRTAYFHRQAHWLLSRFPDAEFVPVPGLCRTVSQAEIEASGWSLTPGRYVGVAPQEVDEDFDFEQAMRDIHVELADLNQETAELAATIQANFEGLGI